MRLSIINTAATMWAIRSISLVVGFSSMSVERTATREIYPFQEWAAQCGVQADNGFCLAEQIVDGNEDWYAATSTGGREGSRVLTVPNEMILSSARIAQDYQGYVEPAFQILEQKGMRHLFPQFYLFLKLLVELEQGENSPYYPWMASLPRKFNTGVSMDEFCLSCLPPFIRSLCQIKRNHLVAFREALQAFEYLSPQAKQDEELAKFAFNVVFSRSWSAGPGDCQIVPVADMLNHGYPANVAVSYDADGNCEVLMKRDVAPGESLHISYGKSTNPSWFMANYGFLNDEAPATFCKILAANPSQELIDVGYDTDKMLFYKDNGAVSQEVWDVMLYSRLERKPELEADRRAFYQAHMSGDQDTKAAIHNKYLRKTCSALQRHVNGILAEVADLAVKMNTFDYSNHPRLPLIKKHNDMVTETFLKVKQNIDQIAASAM
ncbi:SET methyltransferase domain containing protein [Nitzschia inconspicua]|uniref:SET methyltransferase domain containing protein n=1 Tax=Nitzschia inconspicua TaxID=303405 RepID=A0A9K3M4X1_9STRA|nr:SET methyltransferase domain containing protein [Nitzschia inconspicua]